jgi:hypothetical protein
MLIAGNVTATKIITPTIDWITQWSVVITVIILIVLAIWGTIEYFRNRKKPNAPSEEVQAINEMIKEIKGLRQDVKERNNEQTSNKL